MKFGFCGPSYTVSPSAIADEECINRYLETIESPGAQTKWVMRDAPGYQLFTSLPESPSRGSWKINGRVFAVGGTKFVELAAEGTQTPRGTVVSDGLAASIVASNTQVLIISGGHAYCFTLADNTIVDVTGQLAGVPIQAEYNDTYFVVCFQNSNKFQYSDLEDGTSWPGINVNAVSVFPDNIVSIKCDHRELWIWGNQHCQPYYDSGSSEVFDVISGSFIDSGSAATFSVARVDNTKFWVSEDERGARQVWRASGYTPARISTFAVESDLETYTDISGLVAYAYQDSGHLFYVMYIPGSMWSWTYDVSTGQWCKRAEWDAVNAVWGAHRSWNHVYAFGKHLVGDWQSGNLYNLSRDYIDNNTAVLRRYRRSPTIVNEMQWIAFANLIIDYDVGTGPQPPLTDGNGDPRSPQSMLRWSDDRGMNWSNEHTADLGNAGQYLTRVIWWRLGRSRYRVWEESVTDPVRSDIVDAYLNT